MSTSSEYENVYRVKGLDPNQKHCSFCITLDRDFAREMKDLEVPEKQESTAESLLDMYVDTPFAKMRFRGDSFFLTNLTVAVQATGIDLTDETGDQYEYYTHNVDTSSEAVTILAIFEKWVDLGLLLLEEEDDHA